jgi:hypothetical protein
MKKTFLLTLFVLTIQIAQGQTCGPANTNANCIPVAYDTEGTYYYAPTDTQDVGEVLGASGKSILRFGSRGGLSFHSFSYSGCDAGSQCQVFAVVGATAYQCGCLPLINSPTLADWLVTTWDIEVKN